MNFHPKHRRLKRSVLVALALLLLSFGPSVLAQGPTVTGFRALSETAAENFSLPADVQLTTRFELSRADLIYERYQQVFHEALVLGGQLTLYRDPSNATLFVVGAHYPNITATNQVSLNKNEAQRLVDLELRDGLDRRVDLMIDPDSGRYFYRIESQALDSRWFYWLDAETGQILNRYNGLTTACGSLAKPCGFGVEYDKSSPTDVKDLSGLTKHAGRDLVLTSADGRQKTYDHLSLRRPVLLATLASDDDDEWTLLGNHSPGQQALVDIQYYGNLTDDYYLQQYGFDWVAVGSADPDLPVTAMIMRGHLFPNFVNAFWTGTFVAFGDGDQVDFRELTSLDVVAHELSHGVTDFTSNLLYQNESGALNESFSDIMGNNAEFFADVHNLEPAVTLSPDWLVGEDLDLRGTGVLGFRNMADPEEDDDPDHYSERHLDGADNGGVHSNSAISNHAYYLLVNGGMNASCAAPATHNAAHCSDADTQDNNLNVVGIGLADAEQIFFLTMTALPEIATMCQTRLATTAVAAALFGGSSTERQSTKDAWVAVGLTDSVCS